MKIQRKLLSLLGIASIIGGGSALSVLATSCGKGEPFVPAFSLFEDVSVNTEAQAKKAMKSVTWI
jgi:predicted ABC-class ATPase